MIEGSGWGHDVRAEGTDRVDGACLEAGLVVRGLVRQLVVLDGGGKRFGDLCVTFGEYFLAKTYSNGYVVLDTESDEILGIEVVQDLILVEASNLELVGNADDLLSGHGFWKQERLRLVFHLDGNILLLRGREMLVQFSHVAVYVLLEVRCLLIHKPMLVILNVNQLPLNLLILVEYDVLHLERSHNNLVQLLAECQQLLALAHVNSQRVPLLVDVSLASVDVTIFLVKLLDAHEIATVSVVEQGNEIGYEW